MKTAQIPSKFKLFSEIISTSKKQFLLNKKTCASILQVNSEKEAELLISSKECQLELVLTEDPSAKIPKQEINFFSLRDTNYPFICASLLSLITVLMVNQDERKTVIANLFLITGFLLFHTHGVIDKPEESNYLRTALFLLLSSLPNAIITVFISFQYFSPEHFLFKMILIIIAVSPFRLTLNRPDFNIFWLKSPEIMLNSWRKCNSNCFLDCFYSSLCSF